ncbi:ladderlectin-like [Clarias gariepinus]
MARQTEVVLPLLLLAMAGTAYASEHQANSKCPTGWVKYDRRCFFYQASMDWASAEKRCMNLGGHLTSIHSESEYQNIKSFIRTHDLQENPTWIGLSGCQKKYNWFWSDGSRFTFTKWSPYEPNNLFGECCVIMNWSGTKKWNDVPCYYSYPFVCAKSI